MAFSLKELFAFSRCTCARKIDELFRSEFWIKNDIRLYKNKRFKFYHEKNIYLNEECTDVMTIGIDPMNKFEIGARLESKITSGYIILNLNELDELLMRLKETFTVNTIYPKPASSNTVSLSRCQHHYFMIECNEKSMKISEKCLLSLSNNHDSIKVYCQMLELEQNKVEKTFFKLMEEFSTQKDLKSSFGHLITKEEVKSFFEDIIKMHCSCFEKKTIVETSLNFLQWFSVCVSIFIEDTKTEFCGLDEVDIQ